MVWYYGSPLQCKNNSNFSKVNKMEKSEDYFRLHLPVFYWKDYVNVFKWELSELGFNNIE